jgi:hypothetical protein
MIADWEKSGNGFSQNGEECDMENNASRTKDDLDFGLLTQQHFEAGDNCHVFLREGNTITSCTCGT